MPRYHLLLWGPRPVGRDAESWARWIAPILGAGVVQAAGAFDQRMASLQRGGGVTTVSESEARVESGPSAFLLIEAESMAAAIALAAASPERLAIRVQIRALDPMTEATSAVVPWRGAQGAA